MKSAPLMSRMLRIAAGGSIIALLVWGIGREHFAAALSRTDWRWIVPLYANASLMIVLNAVLLRFTMRSAGLQPGLGRVLLAKFLGSFYSLILPGDVFGGAAKWADLSAATGDRTRVFSSMLLTKIALAIPPLVVGSIALAIDNPLDEPLLVVFAAGSAILVLSVTAFVLSPLSGTSLNLLTARLLNGLPAIVRAPGGQLLTSVEEFQRLRSSDYAIALSLSLAVFLLGILNIWLAMTAVGLDVPLWALFWVSMILFISRMLPITVGNLGVRESIFVVAFGLYGVEPAPAVLVGLLMFGTQILTAVIGGAYQFALAAGWASWRGEQP